MAQSRRRGVGGGGISGPLSANADRSRRRGDSAVRRLLGFQTRMEVHAFLKAHDVYRNYSMTDLEHDICEADRIIALLQAPEAVGEQHPG